MVSGTASRSLSAQAEVLIDIKFADARVAGGSNGKSNDSSKGDQLSRDLLELAKALRDGVTSLILLGDRSHHARGLAEHSHGGGGAHIDEWRVEKEARVPAGVN